MKKDRETYRLQDKSQKNDSHTQIKNKSIAQFLKKVSLTENSYFLIRDIINKVFMDNVSSTATL